MFWALLLSPDHHSNKKSVVSLLTLNDHGSFRQRFLSSASKHYAYKLLWFLGNMWPESGTVLTETLQIVTQAETAAGWPDPLFFNSTADSSFPGLFTDPAQNFDFCTTPKNAITQWTTVLRNVLRNETKHGYTTPAFGIARVSQEKHGGIQAIQDISQSPTKTAAVMVRDPLARFASVYLNKCFDLNCCSWYWLPIVERKLPKETPISFRQALDWILSDSFDITNFGSLQSEQRGMKNGGFDRYFTIVGKMNKETLTRDAACIMERAGLSRYNVGAILEEWRHQD